MQPIRRSCQSALRDSDRGCIHAIGSRRAFSRSSAYSRGALPIFVEPSSPKLSSLFGLVNEKILLPKHLTKEQEKLVYRKANQARLEADAVEITLGDVTLPLRHLDRNHLPPRWRTFSEIVRMSETLDDWENVVRMLEGFENAGIRVTADRRAQVVRHLNRRGHHHLILKALQRAKATGLRMHEWKLVVQIFRAAWDKAALADWEADETRKALRFAKQLVELLEDEEHCGGQARTMQVSEHDFRARPAVIAVPTALAAVLALRHGGDVEEVKKLASRLVAALKQNDYEKFLNTCAEKFAVQKSDFKTLLLQARHVSSIIIDLHELVWISTALKTSSKVLGKDLPNADEARHYETLVAKTLEDGCEAMQRLNLGINIAQDSIASYVLTIREKAKALE